MRQLLENGFYNEARFSVHQEKPTKIPSEVFEQVVRRYTVCSLPETQLDFNSGRWELTLKSIDEKAYRLGFTEHAFSQLFTELGLPAALIYKIPLHLIKYNFEKLKETEAMVMLEIDNTDVVTGVFDVRSDLVPFKNILEKIDGEFNSIMVSDYCMRLTQVQNDGFSVRTGDTIKLGWHLDAVSNKKGMKLSSVSGIFRMICSNGSMSPINAAKVKFSKGKNGDTDTAFDTFLNRVRDINSEHTIKECERQYKWLSEKDPTNEMLIDIYKSCAKNVDQDFGDLIIGWSDTERKDVLKFGSINKSGSSKEYVESFLASTTNDYGKVYDILNRMTDGIKDHSISSQIMTQNYAGAFPLKFNI